jgi:hypothetical protein
MLAADAADLKPLRVDKGTGIGGVVESTMTGRLLPTTRYHVELRHDGRSTVKCFVDGKETSSAERIGSRLSGGIFIWIHANAAVRISGLTVDGVLDETQMDGVRQRWVASEVKRLLP